MSWIKRILCTLLLFFSVSAWATSGFVVKNIRFEGLQRVSEAAILNYCPIHIGQYFSYQDSQNVINSLYKSGLVKDVKLLRRNHTLIIRVQEEPVISLISIQGNKKISNKKLKPILKKLGITEGNTLNETNLSEMTAGLEAEYATLGYYAAKVDTRLQQASRNRVAIYITVHEGPIAKVHKIVFVGNHAFSQRQLRDQFQLTTPGLITLITHHDRYSEAQLAKDLQNLQTFYFNHGYLRFHIVSKKVTVSKDHKSVKITVYVYEGDVYRISGWTLKVAKGINKAAIQKFVPLKKNQIFSKQQIIHMDKSIGNYFADRGFAFPDIQVVPKLNDATKTVSLNMNVKTGKRIYVRQINIFGNNRTRDFVVRDQLRQMEQAVYSRKEIQESTRNMRNLPYLTNISDSVVPVPGHPDQVDLNYHVKERNAGKASVQGGYSDVDGFLYGASVTEPNFMGTGKYVGIGFQNSEYQQDYHINYTNPFYTIDGVSRGFSFYYTHTTPGQVNLENYTMDDFGASVNYGIPLTEFTSWNIGASYDHINIGNLNTDQVSPSVIDFTNRYGSSYNQITLNAGIGRSTLDRAIFPTGGTTQGLSVNFGLPAFGSSVAYYKLTYDMRAYWSLGAGFVLSPHTTLGYGGGVGKVNSLPFFDNYYAGGIDTLPGYEPNTLGPKNPLDTGDSQGGNIEVLGGVHLIFPNGISPRLRTALILDAGNIFSTNRVISPPGTAQTNYESVQLKNLRVVTGIMVSWFWPLGAPIDFSIATPINKKPGDQTEIFGFSFGTDI